MANYTPATEIEVYEAENSCDLSSHPSRLAKLLAHCGVYRKIVDLADAIVEMGVYKGASLMRFGAFRELRTLTAGC